MAINYVCSMDQYGAAAGTSYFAANGPSGWQMDNEIMVGDAWGNFPHFVGQSIGSCLIEPTGTLSIGVPTWGSRQGDYALIADSLGCLLGAGFLGGTQTRPETASMGMIVPGATAAVRHIHFAYGQATLPTLADGHGYILDLKASNDKAMWRLAVDPSGRLVVYDGDSIVSSYDNLTSYGAILGITSAPVITPNSWYSINIRHTTVGAADANIEVWIGDIGAGTKVLDITGAAVSISGQASQNIDLLGWLPASMVPEDGGNPRDLVERAVRDIVLSDATGSYNTAPLGQVFTSAQEMRTEDNEGSGWATNTRDRISDGVGDYHTNSTGIRCADAADLEIAAQDFTFETVIRFSTLPVATGAKMEILTKWSTAADLSYRLYYDADTSSLIWEVSTDGAAATVVKTAPWDPLLNRWYHIAVSRETDTTQFTNIYIEGVANGVRQADDNTYFSGAGSLGVGANFASGSTPDAATVFDGFMDETRFTIGTTRYVAAFTPPTSLHGRIIGDDADIADVVLLLGYDSDTTPIDESPVARTLTLNASPVLSLNPADGDYSYQVLNQRPSWDDTWIEAAHTYATARLTMTALPLATETIVIGASTYTWAASAGAAGTVVIGGTVAASFDNLIAAVNGGAGSGTLYGTGTAANASATAQLFADQEILLVASTIGASTVVTTETMTNGSFLATTMDNGQDIPSDSDFTIERLPIDVSGVLAVQGTARAFKTDAGSASMRMDLVGPSAAVGVGTALAIDLNPSYYRQVFEEDPDTTAALTPSTVIGGRLRFKRTA